MEQFLLIIIAFILGTLTHFLKDVVRIRKEEGECITPKQYWLRYPYQNLLYLVLGTSSLLVVYSMEMLNPATAYFIGTAANSWADSLGKRTLTNKVK